MFLKINVKCCTDLRFDFTERTITIFFSIKSNSNICWMLLYELDISKKYMWIPYIFNITFQCMYFFRWLWNCVSFVYLINNYLFVLYKTDFSRKIKLYCTFKNDLFEKSPRLYRSRLRNVTNVGWTGRNPLRNASMETEIHRSIGW